MSANRPPSDSFETLGDLVAGAFVRGQADAAWTSHDPSQDFRPVFSAQQTSAHVAAAITAAREAQFGWAELSPDVRANYLQRLGAAFAARAEEMANAITLETGKPHREALGEAKALAPRIALTLDAGLSHVATVRPNGVDGEARAHAQGVLVVLGPYNYPAHLVNAHVIPALATGNTVVIKPTEFCPLVGQVYAQCLLDAHLPPGVVNLVQGNGDVGKALVAHPDIDGVLFTGSYRTGRAITKACLDHPHKIVALEMGGKNCAVVLDDANLSQALPHIIQGAFLTTGQRCTATSRVLVGRAVKDALIDALATATAALAPGDPWDAAAAFGPLANRPAFERFCQLRDGAHKAGAEVVVEGKSLEGGAFVTPSLHLLPEGKSEAPGYLDEELFGPDICIEVVDDVDAAIARVNASPYGLSNAIFTQDEAKFERFFHRTKSGLLNWNRSTNGASGQLPFGGVGKSGNQRPAGAFATRYTTFPVAYMKGDVAAKAAGFERALELGARPLTLEIEHLARCHDIEARFERVRIPLDDVHGATLRFPLSAFKETRIKGAEAAEAIAAVLDDNAKVTASHLVVHVPPPAAVPDFVATLQTILAQFAEDNLAHVSTRLTGGVSRPPDGKMPRSAMHLERMYAGDFIPRERKAAVVDHGRTVGPHLTSVDDKPLSILDAASQIASLGLGFAADAFIQALDEGELTPALLANASLEAGAHTPAQKNAQAHVDAYANFLLAHAGAAPVDEDGDVAPLAPRHVTFAGGGSEANERAYDLCRVNGEGERAGGTRILAFEGSFHGRTFASLLATYNPVKRAPFEIEGYEASFLPFPAWTDPRDEPEVAEAWLRMWAEGKTPDDGGDPLMGAEIHALCAVREEIEREDAPNVCCVLVEPFQGEGGDNYATARFYNGLRAVTRRAGIPLVFDEVQGGFGLAGPFFWHRHFDLRDAAGNPEFPDCVTVAKKAQVGACISRWEDTRPGAIHVVQAQRGLIHAQEVAKLDAREMEDEVRGRLYRFALEHDDLVENPRNMGFAFAFDLPTKHQANQIIAQRFYRGYMAYIAGERTVRFRLTAAWTSAHLDTLFASLTTAIEALREGGPEWTAPAWVAPPKKAPRERTNLGVSRSRLLKQPRAVLRDLVRLPAGALEMVVDKTRAHLDDRPADEVDNAVGILLSDPGLRDAPPREVLAALAECSLEIENAADPDKSHAEWTEKLGLTPARLLVEALAARIIEITKDDWERYKNQIVAIENATYEEGRRESEDELKALVFADGALSFLAMRRTETGPRAVAYAFGAALENFETDGPAHDVTRGEGTTFYSSNITVAPGARGAGLGQRLKQVQSKRVTEILGDDGKRRYEFLTGRNRVGKTVNMGAINTKLGAYTVEHFRSHQYGDVSGQAIYYRIPAQRPRVVVREKDVPQKSEWTDWGSSVQAPLGDAPAVLREALAEGAFTGPVGTKLTLSNFVSPEVARYCELLRQFAPKGLGHVYFTSGRDELVDKGLRALRVKRPKAQRALTFDHQYFGHSTAAARSLTCDEGQTQPFGWYPWPRVPHPAVAGPDAAMGGLMAAINEVGPEGILGIVIELVGERTGHVMGEDFLADLDKVRQDTGVPLIFVETASGLGRGGDKVWRSDALAIRPDHVWWYAGGQLGHIFTNDAHYVGKPLTLISTWDGDEICALRTREHLLAAHRFCNSGGAMASTFADEVTAAAKAADMRTEGAGLWQAIAAGSKADALVGKCREHQLHVQRGLGDRVVLSPPLSLDTESLALGIERLKNALAAV